MATTVVDVMKRLKAVNIQRVAVKAVQDTRDDLIAWQKDQLWSGKTSTGSFIRPPYRPLTKIIKRRKGQPTDRVTLKDTGDFYEYIIVDIGLETYNLTSEDWKTALLTEKYTDRIFGLNSISLAGYNWDLRPVFFRNMAKATGLPNGNI